MANQRGIVAILPLLLILLALGVLAYFLVYQSGLQTKLGLPGGTPSTKKEPTVSLQTQYQNPFDKNAQYVNQFASYKNAFDALKLAKEI